ncbi:hypothetical protein H310_05386 [Aphanomyces invadans]|uniref:Methyltransferase type 12 domain-containing protein n=1 Tax=Aphanomyces invadans TaxID=157072 RepID=A0A024U9T0_9STRA|nr:hypothetical protein H310_05386 [Aphanomyces invadans]ETW02940.1 hypothetical protein H310_05386 [Aphanomyces invadans]|eukprot:XP_008868324.1 hypothetical protein H310_05386 [Aphanomyces invadans]
MSRTRNALVLDVISSLSSAMVAPDVGNIEGNRRVWDAYAKDWSPSADYVVSMSPQLTHPLEVLGDEWSSPEDLDEVLLEFVYPFMALSPALLHVGEIGSGGGRVSRRIAAHKSVQKFTCLDISTEMLQRAQKTLAHAGLLTEKVVDFRHLPSAWPSPSTLDFVVIFDVMVHMDLHTIYQTLQQTFRLLKPGGYCFMSTANLVASEGWKRFQAQSKFTIGGFYFVCPQMVDFLVAQCGFVVVKTSQAKKVATRANVYFDRDYLVLVQKPLIANTI